MPSLPSCSVLNSSGQISVCPTDQVLMPGLDARQVAATLVETVGSAPDHLVHWFSWHDGVRPDAGWEAAPLGAQILSLQHCLVQLERQLTVNADQTPYSGMFRWDPRVLPRTPDTGGGSFALDTVSGRLLYIHWEDSDDSEVSEDLAAAAKVWLEVLQCGVHRWQDRRWHYEYTDIPLQFRVTRLVG